MTPSSRECDGQTLEVVYTWPDGREEVRYRATAGTEKADELQAQVDHLKSLHGSECPYSSRVVGTAAQPADGDEKCACGHAKRPDMPRCLNCIECGRNEPRVLTARERAGIREAFKRSVRFVEPTGTARATDFYDASVLELLLCQERRNRRPIVGVEQALERAIAVLKSKP